MPDSLQESLNSEAYRKLWQIEYTADSFVVTFPKTTQNIDASTTTKGKTRVWGPVV